jgi:hypothetical protein
MHQTHDEIQEYLDSADRMKARGQITDDDHHKILVCLSYEYLQLDQVTRACALLNRCDPTYFDPGGIQFLQAKADKHYAELLVKLAYRLLQLGLVGADIDLYQTNQPPAQA